MEVKSFEKEGVTVFQVDGEINISTSPELRKMFEKQPAKKVVIHLEKVTYVDSSGLATLVEILKNMRQYGGRLKLSNLSPKIKSLFEITKLDKLFDIKPDEEEAIASFN